MLEIFEDDVRLTISLHIRKESVIYKKGSVEYSVRSRMTDGMPSQIGDGFQGLDTN